MPRQRRPAGRFLSFLLLSALSWMVMSFTHETGHLIGGWCSGGTLRAVELRPWRLPYSIFDPDPRPLVTLWCGPILGVLIPLAAALVVRWNGMRFIADFCLLANGTYLATAAMSSDRFLDTPRLLEYGAHPASIFIYCMLTTGFGYAGFRRECLRLLNAPRDIPPDTDRPG